MPDRTVREDILTSDRVHKLSAEAEVFYRRLMSVVDDFGRYDGRRRMLQGRLYPLRSDPIPLEQIEAMLQECIDADLIVYYFVDEKPFLEILRFRQPVRIKKSQYPDPPDFNEDDYILRFIPLAMRREVLAAGECCLCGATTNLTIDHIQPVTKKGKPHRENLRCLCKSCNCKKGNRIE